MIEYVQICLTKIVTYKKKISSKPKFFYYEGL